MTAFFKLKEQVCDFLGHYPIVGVGSGFTSFSLGISMNEIIDYSTPLLTWVGLIFGVLIALATLVIKVQEIIKNKNKE